MVSCGAKVAAEKLGIVQFTDCQVIQVQVTVKTTDPLALKAVSPMCPIILVSDFHLS